MADTEVLALRAREGKTTAVIHAAALHGGRALIVTLDMQSADGAVKLLREFAAPRVLNGDILVTYESFLPRVWVWPQKFDAVFLDDADRMEARRAPPAAAGARPGQARDDDTVRASC